MLTDSRFTDSRFTGSRVYRFTCIQVHMYTGSQVSQVHVYTGSQVHRFTSVLIEFTSSQSPISKNSMLHVQIEGFLGTLVHIKGMSDHSH
jgi:hypothetical protein